MLFNSGVFAIFMVLFYPLYLIFRRGVLARNALLLIASYIFYGWWDPRFLVLVAVSTSVDYIAALGAAGKPTPWANRMAAALFLLSVTAVSLAFATASDWWIAVIVLAGAILGLGATAIIDRLSRQRKRLAWLFMSLSVNLGILAFFKYANFFISSANEGFRISGLMEIPFSLHVILPVGLSFYTFQAISRTVDSYSGRYDPQYSLINYAAFHAFFPQLVAGPIERAGHLMPQFERVLPLDVKLARDGARLFLWGLAMKMIVADNLGPIADSVFAPTSKHTAAETLVGVLAFSFQIYADFAGYSNMARGLARMLGFDLMINFNLPYFSRTPSEFWRRWHISLSSWLRDYLYIPLGGNRGDVFTTNRNLMSTMVLGGLWHGAGWQFVTWGGLHGLYLILYRRLGIDQIVGAARGIERWVTVAVDGAAWGATMTLVAIGWIFFRASSFGQAMGVLRSLAGVDGFDGEVFAPLLHFAFPLFVIEAIQRRFNIAEVTNCGPWYVRFHITIIVLLCILLFAPFTERPFIYFDF